EHPAAAVAVARQALPTPAEKAGGLGRERKAGGQCPPTRLLGGDGSVARHGVVAVRSSCTGARRSAWRSHGGCEITPDGRIPSPVPDLFQPASICHTRLAASDNGCERRR